MSFTIETVISAATDDDETLSRLEAERLREAFSELEKARAMPLAFPLRSPGHAVWLVHALADLDDVPQRDRSYISGAVERFVSSGHGDVRKIFGEGISSLALRVGSWRVFFQYATGVVRILRILPRKEAYRA